MLLDLFKIRASGTHWEDFSYFKGREMHDRCCRPGAVRCKTTPCNAILSLFQTCYTVRTSSVTPALNWASRTARFPYLLFPSVGSAWFSQALLDTHGNKSVLFKGTAPCSCQDAGCSVGIISEVTGRELSILALQASCTFTNLEAQLSPLPLWRKSFQVTGCTLPHKDHVIAEGTEFRTMNAFCMFWSQIGNLGVHWEWEGKLLKLFFTDFRLFYSDHQVHTFLGHCLFPLCVFPASDLYLSSPNSVSFFVFSFTLFSFSLSDSFL